MGLQRHVQPIGVDDPVLQAIVQCHLKAPFFEHGKPIVGPLQPSVLGRVAGNSKPSVLTTRQARIEQAADEIKFHLGIAL